jgi:hypothetical protein
MENLPQRLVHLCMSNTEKVCTETAKHFHLLESKSKCRIHPLFGSFTNKKNTRKQVAFETSFEMTNSCLHQLKLWDYVESSNFSRMFTYIRKDDKNVEHTIFSRDVYIDYQSKGLEITTLRSVK